MAARTEDWASVLERLIRGDRLALLRVSRFLSGLLTRWNGYDFRDEWDDLIQEVVLATSLAVREGRIREPKAIAGYLRSTLRFKYIDRLRTELGARKEGLVPWEQAVEDQLDPEEEGTGDALRGDLLRALEKLPPKKRSALLEVYVRGRTYEEAAEYTGIPLGTLKRYLREGLGVLRLECAERLEGD